MIRTRRWEKDCQIWKLEDELALSTPMEDIHYVGEYLSLKENGELRIERGYSWNGCSPKVEVMGMVFGTPEGALPKESERSAIEKNLAMMGYTQFDWYRPKTYYASLVHDSLYQIGDTYAARMDRKLADDIFLNILKAYRFPLARLYYLAVRVLGKYFWGPDS